MWKSLEEEPLPEEWRRLPLAKFERTLLRGALIVAADASNPIRGNLFSAAIRELVNYLLHRLGPDDEVTACCWYTPVRNTNGPTRKQRIKYATQGGLPDSVIEKAGANVADLQKEILEAVDDLNRFTHVRPGTVLFKEEEIAVLAGSVLEAMTSLFASFKECQSAVGDSMAEQVNRTVLGHLLNETLSGMYNIATHYRQGSVWIDEITVDEIDAKKISFSFVGSAEADLQWGSDGDVERGDGHVHTASFPMSGSVWAPVTDIQQLRDLEVEVDTESWFGDRPDDNEEDEAREPD